MITTRPIILVGQLYLHPEVNEYLTVTKNDGGEVSYGGLGFRGILEDEDFIERFQPVDPADVSAEEISDLISLCPKNTTAKVGFIKD